MTLALVIVGSLSATTGVDAADEKTNGLGSLLDDVLQTLNLKTTVGPTPGFVEATHPDPATLHFIPTGTPRPTPAYKVKSPSEIEASKAALDAAQQAQLQPRPAPAPHPSVKLKKAKPRAAVGGD